MIPSNTKDEQRRVILSRLYDGEDFIVTEYLGVGTGQTYRYQLWMRVGTTRGGQGTRIDMSAHIDAIKDFLTRRGYVDYEKYQLRGHVMSRENPHSGDVCHVCFSIDSPEEIMLVKLAFS